MIEGNDLVEFERAFRRTAERHERVWIFSAVSMLSLLMLGTRIYAMRDYGLVTKGGEIRNDPVKLGNEKEFTSGRPTPSTSSVTSGRGHRARYWTTALLPFRDIR